MENITDIEVYNAEKIKDTDFLWKFVSIEKFLSIILNEKLYFTRLDRFEDSLEGVEPKLLLLNYKKNILLKSFPCNELKRHHSISLFPSETDNLIDKLKETQKFNFANCWFLSSKNIESVAMWNLYSDPNSVALNIKYTDFYEKIKNKGLSSRIKLKKFIWGPVDYIDFQNPNEIRSWKDKIKFTTFVKDKSFSHENEFRMVAEIEKYPEFPFKPKLGISKYMQKDSYDKTRQIYELNILLNDFFDYKFEIVFHPKISEWIKEDIIKILKKFEVSFKTRDSNSNLK